MLPANPEPWNTNPATKVHVSTTRPSTAVCGSFVLSRCMQSAAEPAPQLGLRGRHGRRLTHDLLEAVFSRLSAKDLAAAELTCRHWFAAAAIGFPATHF